MLVRILACAASLALVAVGCSAQPATSAQLRKDDLKGLPPKVEQPVVQSEAQRPAARVDGAAVMWEELQPLLTEASGALIVREVALDRGVRAECERRGIVVTPEQVEDERTRLAESIQRDAATEPADSGVLLETIRRTRGLGEHRFTALLERNARLRALVRKSVEVADWEIEQALQIRYGERCRIRVIVTAAEQEAIRLKGEIEKSPAPDVAFARSASLKSTDASAVRGGLLEPISPVDQTYPQSLRSLLPSLEEGKVSAVVAVDTGFAIALLDARIPSTAPPRGADVATREEVRIRKERIAMEDEARRILARMEIVAIDADLAWSLRAAAPSR